jgi:hypothetical protein
MKLSKEPVHPRVRYAAIVFGARKAVLMVGVSTPGLPPGQRNRTRRATTSGGTQAVRFGHHRVLPSGLPRAWPGRRKRWAPWRLVCQARQYGSRRSIIHLGGST